ncbi:MAG: S8 family serine peptidase, partial [Candidatus Cryptobacteroides sp.]
WGYNSAMADPLYYSRGYSSDEEYSKYQPLEKEAFDYFIYHAGSRNGVIDGGVIVFASGNEYAAMAAYPGAYKDYICVSALAGDWTPSTYSNYGPGVDICAPGGDTDYHCSHKGGILSTLPPHVSDGLMYGYMEGTSMACPHVSGVVALGMSYAAKLHKHYDSREFRDIVLKSVRDVNPHLTGEKLYHFMWGSVGETIPTLVDLKRTYYGNMGKGAADAAALLRNIESSGAELALPNVYIATGTEQTLDLGLCFGIDNTTFTARVDDASVASVTVSGMKAVVTGLKPGSTKLTVNAAGGNTQESIITVRNSASEGGWL